MSINTHLPRGIRQRGDKFFVDVSIKGQRKTATLDTMAEAITVQAQLRADLLTGRDTTQHRSNGRVWSLSDALTKTLSMPKPEGWRGCSYEKTGTLHIEGAMQFMGPDRKLDTISRDLIDAWLHECETGGNSDATINRKVSALSKVLKVAVEFGGLDALPKMPRLRKERVGRIRFLTYGEEARMLGFFKMLGREDMADFVTILIETGMRRGELLNLRPQDVDMKNGVIMVYGTEGKGTKNGRIRSVPMTSICSQALSARLEGAVVFDLSESAIRHLWDRGREHFGFAEDKDFVLHACRHTCASRLIQAGISLPVVKDWLGHSNIQTTMRYAHLFPKDLMNAAAALERKTQ